MSDEQDAPGMMVRAVMSFYEETITKMQLNEKKTCYVKSIMADIC